MKKNNIVEISQQSSSELTTGEISLTLFLTNACNEKCEHCFYWQELNTGRQDEITVDEISKLANGIGDNLTRISLTGGEPFLRKDFKEIASVFINRPNLTSINIVTNGMLKKRIIEVVNFILHNDKTQTRLLLCISLDGLEAKHDHIRRVPGSFKKATRTIKELKLIADQYPQLEVSVITTVSQDNFPEFIDLNKYVENDLGVYQRVNLIRSPKTGVFGVKKSLVEESFEPAWVKPFDDLELSHSQVDEVVGYFTKNENWRDYHKLILNYSQLIVEKKRKVFTCNAPYTDLVVYPNCDFSFCEYIKPLGNLRNYEFSFTRYWNSKISEKRRDDLINCACNHPCNLGFNLADNPELNKLLPKFESKRAHAS